MSWYRAGSVTMTPGSTTVIGVNTAFVANCRVGDAFLAPNGAVHEITNIASDTALSIYPAYGSTDAYAVGPMQGYDKMLADKAGAILQQWGSTLAGLGDVASQDIVPVAMGGTGGATAAAGRAGLGLKSAAVADVIGTVAAGAIIERGENSSGSYTKYLDGSLTCWSTRRVPKTMNAASGSLFFSAIEAALPYPTPFSAIPTVSITATGEFECFTVPAGLSNQSSWPGVYIASQISRSTTATIDICYVAQGRWK